MIKYKITLKYTDGGESTEHRTLCEDNFLLGCLRMNISRTSRDDEYVFSFVPSHEVRLSQLTLEFGVSAKELVYYNNGDCTNVFAGLTKGSDADFTSRDIIMARANGTALNIAFTSFDRFFTRFIVKKNIITVKYYLENKAVRSGESYRLEKLCVNDEEDGQKFFEYYCTVVAENYKITKIKPPVCGWSSWSCLYGRVTEGDVLRQGKLLSELSDTATLIQVDDGWLKESNFAGHWVNHPDKFPSGIPYLADKLSDMGQSLGLWVAPGMISESSSLFDSFKQLLYTSPDKARPSFNDVYPLNIGSDEVLAYTREIFKRLAGEYKCVYLKVDFLTNLLYRAGADGSAVEYEGGYSVELYRRFIKTIREAVGDDVFLLACGAPIGESVGIFDGIRTSADITWGGAGGDNHPGAWSILVNDARSTILRNAYNGRLFVNDPDALLVRDYLSDENDGLCMTYEEAELWASVVSCNGGHILINEELDRLSKERVSLFTKIIPPTKTAFRPLSYFSDSSDVMITYSDSVTKEKKRVYALYNFSSTRKTAEIPQQGHSLTDMKNGEVISGKITLDGHSARLIVCD